MSAKSQVDTGAQSDAIAIPDVVEAEAEYHQLIPEKFMYDTAAGLGKTRALVADATDGKIQLVASLPSTHTPNGTFTPAQFQLSADNHTLICSNAQRMTLAYESGSGNGRNFRFLSLQCCDCPLGALCRA